MDNRGQQTAEEQVHNQIKPDVVNYGNTSPVRNNPEQISRKKLSRKLHEVLVYLYAAIAVLLLSRFIFSMVAARNVAPFVDFVYQLTYPLMIPFANMFGVIQSGPYRLEFEIFVALIMYAVIFFGVAKLIDIIFG